MENPHMQERSNTTRLSTSKSVPTLNASDATLLTSVPQIPLSLDFHGSNTMTLSSTGHANLESKSSVSICQNSRPIVRQTVSPGSSSIKSLRQISAQSFPQPPQKTPFRSSQNLSSPSSATTRTNYSSTRSLKLTLTSS